MFDELLLLKFKKLTAGKHCGSQKKLNNFPFQVQVYMTIVYQRKVHSKKISNIIKLWS